MNEYGAYGQDAFDVDSNDDLYTGFNEPISSAQNPLQANPVHPILASISPFFQYENDPTTLLAPS
jgi:hypothetical protein